MISMFVLAACQTSPPATPPPPKETPPAEPEPEPEPAAAPVAGKSGLAAKIEEQVRQAKLAQAPDDVEDTPTAEPEPPEPKPRPRSLAPPTEAELRAWDRKDPEGEKHLYKWDRANRALIEGYFADLQCFRAEMIEQGERSLASGAAVEEAWFEYKRDTIPVLDKWMQTMFVSNPRILAKSKAVGQLLELHEIVMINYPRAYNDGSKTEISKAEALWVVATSKADRYLKAIGGSLPKPSAADCRARTAGK